ncbi:hypothetical protein [Caenispirillum bisanense]|uniref:hypothetical protein n=1 Tax=Caenispirillum bisanense TaxID=414052 RepID=UPI0031D6788A
MTRRLAAAMLAGLVLGVAAAGVPAPAAAQQMPMLTDDPSAESLTFAVHLGSYKLPGSAPKDWHRMADFWPGVLYFRTMTREVDIPGKGRFMRLYLVGDPSLSPILCRELTKRGKYCQIHDLRAGSATTLHDGESG